ncbi:universal stress protein [uncultured Ramlibacter sp.]|uniref:universal stress protein n=1 Tax=uncultured Ramlibacter sp. TaxID=260755 RepID=UPI00261EF057|nr:universal stress protein [uncultured Ramlibacter sp.]
MYQSILVATDGSDLSDKAVSHAIGLAAATGAALLALHVVPDYPMSYFIEGSVAIAAVDLERIERSWTEQGQATVDAICAAAAAKGVQARGIVLRADRVGETVVATARKHQCDLIVMASHGRKGLQRVLLGSETQYVLAHAQAPVMVLR